MKLMNHNLMRRAQSVLATGLLLGGIFAATAQTLPPEASLYRLGSNYVAGTVAPYNSGGGIPAQSYIYTPVYNVTNNTCTLNWYGTYGYYTVMGSADGVNYTAVTNVVSTNFACQVVLKTTNNYSSYYLSQANSYAGSDQCSSCHGDKYGGYETTMHSGVYSNPGAVANFSPACLTVGYQQPSGFWNASTNANLENVGCENCHGPAGWHKNSDHNVIVPVVSEDPAICGTCHQGPLHPTYQEYTNIIASSVTNLPMGIIQGGVGHSFVFSGGSCSVCHAANNRMAMINEYNDMKAGNPHPLTFFANSSDQTVLGGATCATCHDPHASNYVAQLRYPTFSTNYYAQPNLLYQPSVLVTNWVDDGSMTNTYLTTNTLTMNTVFDALYNPNVQVCGQCHGGGRGMRWDGSTYAIVTNLVATSPVTNTLYVDITTNVTVTQVFSNTFYVDVTTNASGTVQVFTNGIVYTNGTVQVYDNYGNLYTNGLVQVITNSVPVSTNSYTYSYVVGRYATNQVTLSKTNPVVGVSTGYYPLIPYTNSGTVYYSTNSSGEKAPHFPVQYNVLIGQLDYDYAARGGPPNVLTDPHTLAPNQCADCHVPSYAVNAGTNVTGHTFISDNNGCLAQCHSSLGSTAALATKTLNSKITCSNSIDRVVSLLKQWGMTVAPAILRTNYGPCAWEYPSPLAYFGAKTTNFVATSINTATNTTNYAIGSSFITGWGITNMVIGVKSTYVSNSITYATIATNMILGWTNGIAVNFLTGPPSAWNKSGGQPSSTNDNLQLSTVPQDIRMARFALYVIYEDQSYGVHNPTYVKSLLAWAENDVMNRFITANYLAAFSASATSGTGSLTVTFTNYNLTGSVYNWTFGDGGVATGSNPTYTYTTPGLYSVTCTVDGTPLTRTKYILVQ